MGGCPSLVKVESPEDTPNWALDRPATLWQVRRMPKKPSLPPLVTAFEAGLILNMSARTVQRLAERGKLTVAMKLPGPRGAYLYYREDVERMRGAA